MKSRRAKEKNKKSRKSSKGGEASAEAMTFDEVGAASDSPQGRQKGSRFLIGLALLAGFVLRSIYLEIKPPHFDEGINGFFVTKVWQEGFYRYDPTNFHGPLYFYVLLLAETFFGRGIFGFRFVTGLIGLANVALVAKHRRFVGRAAVWAAVLMALSTASVFYSRYSIHESLFIFFQLLFSFGWFEWRESRSRRSVAFMSAGFFGMFAVKETFFIFFGVWAIAVACERAWRRWRKEPAPAAAVPAPAGSGFWRAPATTDDIAAAVGLGSFVSVCLYTGFFIFPGGVEDMFRSLAFWVKTGTGNSGHEKPALYWLELLWRYEKPALVALIASVPVFFLSGWRLRILTLVAVGTWMAYTIIPYKTPWLILNLLWPLAFVFGQVIVLVQKRAGAKGFRYAHWLVGFGLLAPMCATMIDLNFTNYANEKEPYVYVQSTNTMKRAVGLVTERVKRFPEDLNMKLRVLVKDPWPLPWVFGRYPNLSYGRPEMSTVADADVIFIDNSEQMTTEPLLTAQYYRIPFQIRDSYENGFAYLRIEKFQDMVPADTNVVGMKP